MSRPTVTFLPYNRSIQVSEGESLIRAALQAGVHINASCGGEGVCAKCRVRVEQGQIDGGQSERLSTEDQEAGYRLACQTRVSGDVTIRVPVESAMDRSVFDHKVTPRRTARIQQMDFDSLKERGLFIPPVEKVHLKLTPPDAQNNMPDLTRLIEYLKLQGEHKLELLKVEWERRVKEETERLPAASPNPAFRAKLAKG